MQHEDIERLVETTGIPVFTEQSARGVISDDHPLCAGYSDGRVNDAAKSIHEADALILLGKKLDYTISFGGPPTIGATTKIIQVEPAWEQVGTARDVELGIIADPGAVVRQLADEASTRSWPAHPMIGSLKSAITDQVVSLDKRVSTDGQLHAMDLHSTVKHLIDDDTCLIFEGADFGFYGASYHPALKQHRWITNGTLGMLGWGVPYGIGAQVALPDSRVVVFTGDGGFGFNGFEVDTALRHNLPVVFIVGNDRVWGIDYHQQDQLFGKTVATTMLPRASTRSPKESARTANSSRLVTSSCPPSSAPSPRQARRRQRHDRTVPKPPHRVDHRDQVETGGIIEEGRRSVPVAGIEKADALVPLRAVPDVVHVVDAVLEVEPLNRIGACGRPVLRHVPHVVAFQGQCAEQTRVCQASDLVLFVRVDPE